MDNGEVIPALNESWTFMGANMMEWMSGGMVFLMSTECVHKVSHAMPLLLLLFIGTTYGLATLRKAFPDEERGVRNRLMVAAGMAPPGIPAPCQLQPRWSGAPVRQLKKDCRFQSLELGQVLTIKKVEDEASQFNNFVPKIKKVN